MQRRRLTSRTLAAALLGALPMAAGGCGLLLTHGPPEGHERLDHFTCTESNVGPILDLAYWGGGGLLTLFLGTAESSGGMEDIAAPSAALSAAAGLSSIVVSVASASAGFKKTRQCRAALQQLAERRARGLLGGATATRAAQSLVRTVVLSPWTDTLAVGQRAVLIPFAYDADGAAIPNATFVWSSSNDAVASVSGAGIVTARGMGTAVIAARAGNAVGTARIVVLPKR